MKKHKNIIPISTFTFSESTYAYEEKRWKAETLYNFCKAKEYPIQDLPLFGISLSGAPFDCSTLYNFLFQYKRVQNCSLKYPIIIDSTGTIADGYHRICKAILRGDTTIKAIRMLEMPAYDYIEK